MRSILYGSGLVLLSACSSAPVGEDGSGEPLDGPVAVASSALAESVSANLSIYQEWRGGYCARVAATNRGSYPTNTWTVTVNLNGTVVTSSVDGSFTSSLGKLTIKPSRLNGTIAPGATVNPVPRFCASRTNTALPSVISASGNYCGTVYPDRDHDGYGDPSSSLYTCSNPSGYVSNKGDCCDSDATTHPGQTAYYATTNGCGSYDYDCDGIESAQSNGPTNCAAAVGACVASSDATTCVPSGTVPAGCNGFTDYQTAPCGVNWNVLSNYCYGGCSSGTCYCYAGTHVSSIQPQACR